MLRTLLFTLLVFSSLYGNKVLYLSYEQTPQRIVKGEIFSITLKAIPTKKEFRDIAYTFDTTTKAFHLYNTIPYRKKEGHFLYDTFYLKALKPVSKLPDIDAKLITKQTDENITASHLAGEKVKVITLNPKDDFCGIIAHDFALQEYKTTSYDTKHNIVVLVATAQRGDLGTMHFKHVYKQGIESLHQEIQNAKITYYVVIPKKIENFTFTYFNLEKNRYVKMAIPIIVDDDSVVAQSDLKPQDQSRQQLKMIIAASVAFVAFGLIVWRKKYIYLLFILLPLGYILSLTLSQKDICIKANTDIHLLPVDNGTIFETTQTQLTMHKEGAIDRYVKVKLQNNKIGWVKNEDICAY